MGIFKKRYDSKTCQAYRRVFNENHELAEAAKEVLNDLKSTTLYNETSVGNSELVTYFNEGMKHVLRHMLQMSAIVPVDVLERMEDHIKHQVRI